MVASGAVSASFLGNYMNKRGVRSVVLVSAVWCCVGFFLLSASSQLWMFYLTGAAMGLLGSTCIYLAANVIVQQSYSSNAASAVLGLVMAGAGIGGVIWSSVVPVLLDRFGWRFGYRVLGVCWLILAVISVLILGKQELTVAFGHAKTSVGGTSKKEALRSFKFYLVAMVMCVVTVCSCISQQLPSLLGGQGYGSDQISVMISVMTASSAVGTVMEGVICSKLGIKYTMAGILVMYAAGFLMLVSGGLVYPALVCLAFGAGSIGTLMPIVVRNLFGGREYAAIWSVVITCSSVASFLATPVWGMVYDFFGTYAPALLLMPVLLVIALIGLLAAFRQTK
jgi:MFS family permease